MLSASLAFRLRRYLARQAFPWTRESTLCKTIVILTLSLHDQQESPRTDFRCRSRVRCRMSSSSSRTRRVLISNGSIAPPELFGPIEMGFVDRDPEIWDAIGTTSTPGNRYRTVPSSNVMNHRSLCSLQSDIPFHHW